MNLRKERLAAAAKSRDEIRHAIRQIVLSEKLNVDSIIEEAKEALKAEIMDRARKEVDRMNIQAVISQLLKDEIARAFRGSDVKLEKLVGQELTKYAADFVSQNVLIKIKEGESW